jgi:hypothetical protein
MIQLMKYTYMLEPEKIKKELDKLWDKYQKIIQNKEANWEELNEARAILFLTGNIYCEDIAVKAIDRRLHLLKEKLSLIEFFDLIDKESNKLKQLREDTLFLKLEKFYRIIKEFKNRYHEGKFYLDEEKFIKEYNNKNPDKNTKIGYKGEFNKEK